MIEISRVSWTYPHAEAPALRDLDLRIEPGQFVVLCGASGSGKSTVLRLINGLVPQFHDDGLLTGTVTTEGMITTEVELDALGLVTGTVLQHPRRQFFTDSAREETAFAMENFGFPTQRDPRARRGHHRRPTRKRIPIEQRLQHVSGGSSSRSPSPPPPPTTPTSSCWTNPVSNLSADAVHRLTATLGELKAAGVTIVVAEHRLRYLQNLIDRVVVMRDGAIDIEWTAEQFRTVPDELLAQEGLRGEIRSPDVPVLAATGGSIAHPAPIEEVPSGALELDGIQCRLGGARFSISSGSLSPRAK